MKDNYSLKSWPSFLTRYVYDLKVPPDVDRIRSNRSRWTEKWQWNPLQLAEM